MFTSQESIDAYENLSDEADKKHALNLENPERRIFADAEDSETDGFTYLFPCITDARALLAGKIIRTCFVLEEGYDEWAIKNIFSGESQIDRLMLVLDKEGALMAYCRFSYDKKNQGLNVNTIVMGSKAEISAKLGLVENRHFKARERIWGVVERGLYAQMNANNATGRNLIHRINCKSRSDNDVIDVISARYKEVKEIDGVRLQERGNYKTEDWDNKHTHQYVIHSPELDKYNEQQEAKEDQQKVKKVKSTASVGIKREGAEAGGRDDRVEF